MCPGCGGTAVDPHIGIGFFSSKSPPERELVKLKIVCNIRGDRCKSY